MKLIVIINKSTKTVVDSYIAKEIKQSNFAGPWGNADLFLHVEISPTLDPECLQVDENFSITADLSKVELKQHANALRVYELVVTKAMHFGTSLMRQFAAENIVLGITQDGKTSEVRIKMGEVINALVTGSLYDAIDQANAITDFDDKYVTPVRIRAFVNKIQDYLGIPRT